MYPAAGSHANFFESALYLGSSAEEGVGCDDTRGPTYDVRPVVKTIPSDPAAARSLFPWIAFEGRWGELQPAFFNGPTGPNLKTQWTEPISVSEGWRDRSYAVPAGGALGTGTTDFFCTAVGAGSNALRRPRGRPAPRSAGPRSAARARSLRGSRARRGGRPRRSGWRAAAPGARSSRAAARMYARRLRLFLGIGLVLLPISCRRDAPAGARPRARRASRGSRPRARAAGCSCSSSSLIGTALTLLGLSSRHRGHRAGARRDRRAAGRSGRSRAYRLAFDRTRPLLGAIVIASQRSRSS